MLERVLIAGAGGQGVLSIGHLLARTGVTTFPHVTYYPAYGAEVRGGTCHCQVILSDEEIYSPVSDRLDTIMILNHESAVRFLPQREDNTLVVLNTSLCDPLEDANVINIKATDIASEIGQIKVANVVMLGAYLARRTVVPVELVEARIRDAFTGKPTALINKNIEALGIGLHA